MVCKEIYDLKLMGTGICNLTNSNDTETYRKLNIKSLNLKNISNKNFKNIHMMEKTHSFNNSNNTNIPYTNKHSNINNLRSKNLYEPPKFSLDFTKISVNKNNNNNLKSVLSSRLSAFDVNIIKEIEKKKPLSVSY